MKEAKKAIETIPVAMDQAMHVLKELVVNGDLILQNVIDLKQVIENNIFIRHKEKAIETTATH